MSISSVSSSAAQYYPAVAATKPMQAPTAPAPAPSAAAGKLVQLAYSAHQPAPATPAAAYAAASVDPDHDGK